MRWLVVISLFLSAGSAGGASFDCEKASTYAERAVCSDLYLSHLDEALSNNYRAAINKVSSREMLQKEQRLWLGKRDACDEFKCVYDAYTERLKELNGFLFKKKGMGLYRCGTMKPGPDSSSHSVNFEIKDGILSDFNAVTSVAGKEFAVSYTNTCTQHRGNFYQTSGNSKYTLSFYQPQNDPSESLECEAYVEDIGDKFRVHSSRCLSECMNFDFEVSKHADCYHSP